ncbi:RagB/SusD family nutrient uptake outer membrane protein [Larkinella soli]|uniref:RagB/SusD family nutrient uptake outer membrane protein n=1 Tax=Larkinella soli TaxID=1770527 RepID=UPI000FFBC2C8|nr:RagB/SusD family nutrient uptake outer membrane protein [Larkinella soli]
MKRTLFFLTTALSIGVFSACKEQLDVKNPNQPTTASANSESGVIALAQGGVYVNGFQQYKYPYDGVSGYFWTGAIGFHEIMADVIGVEAANQFLNQIGCPDYVILDDGTKVLNPNSPKEQVAMIREINQNANAGQNTLYYEWAYMYALNSSMNSVLELADKAAFTGDAATKKATLQAWAHWWKGYAYARIGSIYYAGLINNAGTGTNNTYVTKEKIIEESNASFDKATQALSAISNTADYTTVMNQLIPTFNQVGKGRVPTPDMWKRGISTMKARNLLANTPVKNMTAAQWQQVLTLTNAGLTASDNVFTGRSNDNGDFLAAANGAVAPKATGDAGGGITYKVSERLIQDFKPADKRLVNNFRKRATPWIGNSDRGNAFNTRYDLLDGGSGQAGVIVMSSKSVGQYELYLASTYEENELMKAEAKLYTGDVEGGLKIIDAIRTMQGAGLPAVAGTGLALEAAKEELRSERRIVLAFRGLSFYDARRWGVIEDVAKGGGRKNAVVVDKTGKVNTKATINYNFLDYWDVPDNELAYNKPGDGSAPVKNPR